MNLLRTSRLALLLSLPVLVAACSPSTETLESTDRHENGSAESAAGNEELAAAESWLAETEASWSDELRRMSEVLQLGEAEQTQLQQTYQQQAAIWREFMETTGKTLKDLESQIKTAVKERSLSKMRALVAEAKPLRAKLTELLEQRQSALIETLSDKHQIEWRAYQLVERFQDLTESMEFSAEQKSKIKQLGLEAAENARSETNPAAAGLLKLQKLVEQQVLDPVQRKAFDAIKRKNPLSSLLK